MPFPSGTYINQITDPAVRAELEQLYSLFQGYLSSEHKDSGAHGAVTADSLAVTGAGTFNGLLTADADGVLPVKIGPFGTGLSAGGLGDAGLNIGGKWYVRAQASSTPGGGSDYELQVWDLTNDATTPAMRLVYATDGWRLMHGSGSTKTLKLGSSATRIDEINVLTQNIITACNSTAGYKEFARSVALGVWTDVTYAAGNFTANAGTWTVQSGDQLNFQYMVVGKTLYVNFQIVASSTSAGMGTQLKIALPGGFTAAKSSRTLIYVLDNGTAFTGMADVAASGTVINVFRDATANLWTSGVANNTGMQGQLALEIQ